MPNFRMLLVVGGSVVAVVVDAIAISAAAGVVGQDHGVDGHFSLGRDGVLAVLLDGLEGEVADEQADDVILGEEVLAFGIADGKFGDGPGHHGLNIHRPFLEHLRKDSADACVEHLVHTLWIAAQEADGPGGALLALCSPFLDQLEERTNAGHEGRRGVGAVLEGAVVEFRDLLPNQAENRLVGGDRGESKVTVVVQPGHIPDGVLQLGGHLLEGCSGYDGEDALYEAVGCTALTHEGEGLLEDLLCVVHDPASGALIEVSAGGLAE
ncbi:unnamed protein product [Spirodela intermedia]|uniref:Uncharacterized protein n=1 Tax=Spirodela intermedia TaxID=51605 RepID=A0A7I8JTK4_SPIIN|nr:unnamed protein product [Spirodela intermedia]CAA6673498.1 unnamed protein product [Spirodela intermedia]